MPSNKALQTDKDKLSRLLHSQESRQPAFAAELGRYTAESLMHCPACKEILKRRGELLYCTNLELDFPAEVSRFIDEAIADFESGARSSLEGDALPSQWHCLNCGSKMHYQGTNLVCEQCAFSIGGRIQHFMQNRVGHS